MRNIHLPTTMVLTMLLYLVYLPAFAGNKVEICHLPPGNPDNWHTITVSENALPAHLNHGDHEGSCLENCETLCSDDDVCTQEVESNLNECACLSEPTPVNCDDSNECTSDTCNSENDEGCVYDTDIMNDSTCDDGDPNTTGDVCTDGVCAGTAGPSCSDCFDCGNNNPCDEAGSNELFSHCDPQAYIQCNIFFGCRVIDCGQGAEWDQVSLQCIPFDDGTSGCTGCFDCGNYNPCDETNSGALFSHCDPQAYIQCNQFFGCRLLDCGLGSEWDSVAETCVALPL